MKLTGGEVDFIIKDKEGNIVSSTKRDRTEQQEWFAKKVEQHRPKDKILDQMLKSYKMSVRDPDNEFVHLYEVRDALSKKFGSTSTALKQLNITKKEWDKIGVLANTQPYNQGRHRGSSAGALRDAEILELETGRKSVVNLINKYLEYLS